MRKNILLHRDLTPYTLRSHRCDNSSNRTQRMVQKENKITINESTSYNQRYILKIFLATTHELNHFNLSFSSAICVMIKKRTERPYAFKHNICFSLCWTFSLFLLISTTGLKELETSNKYLNEAKDTRSNTRPNSQIKPR